MIQDLTGRMFGRLTVQWPVGRIRNKQVIWLCSCDCGNMKCVNASSLKRHLTRSCGCFHLEKLTTHGHSRNYGKTPELIAFNAARQRCTNPKCKYFNNYGGRGIKFLFNSFEEFYQEIGQRPDGLTLERIDNNGHYERGNVKWATRKEQSANRRISARANG